MRRGATRIGDYYRLPYAGELSTVAVRVVARHAAASGHWIVENCKGQQSTVTLDACMPLRAEDVEHLFRKAAT